MKNRGKTGCCVFAACLALSLGSAGAWADKPEWAGGGKQKKSHQEERDRHDRYDRDDRRERHDGALIIGFGSNDRRIVSDYYGAQARAGKCPPGLANKHNACLPPAHTKNWLKRYPLPPDVLYYNLPRDFHLPLPAPPPNHRYVQVAGDVLLIAVGSSMVVDAIEDILR